MIFEWKRVLMAVYLLGAFVAFFLSHAYIQSTIYTPLDVPFQVVKGQFKCQFINVLISSHNHGNKSRNPLIYDDRRSTMQPLVSLQARSSQQATVPYHNIARA